MSTQVVRLRREKIEACMTCPLCNKLLKEATTISLCLHTFCRKCIYEKFSNEDVDSCPMCDINLGCVPVDKLRPDHNLQDIRAKIFPLKRRKIEALEVIPSVSPPAKRKERSLSSLVVSTPRVSMQTGITGRRSKAGVRKGSVPRSASPATEGTPEKEEDSLDDHLEGSSSPETLNKIIQNKKQFLQSCSAKSSNDQIHGEDMENSHEAWEGKVDLWKPLNTLVEAANRSKFSKADLQQQSHAKPDLPSSGDAGVCVTKVKAEDNGLETESRDGKDIMSSVPGPTKCKRLHPSTKNQTSGSADPSSSQPLLKVIKRKWKDGPIWFSLVASSDPQGGEPLPQLPTAFLRVDGKTRVSDIQKYLVKKLDLASEEEVQLMCYGSWVSPNLPISFVLDMWLCTQPTGKKVRANVGDPAKDYVMVMYYYRKILDGLLEQSLVSY